MDTKLINSLMRAKKLLKGKFRFDSLDDAVQECFIKFHRRDLSFVERPVQYFCKALRRIIFDEYDKNSNRRKILKEVYLVPNRFCEDDGSQDEIKLRLFNLLNKQTEFLNEKELEILNYFIYDIGSVDDLAIKFNIKKQSVYEAYRKLKKKIRFNIGV